MYIFWNTSYIICLAGSSFFGVHNTAWQGGVQRVGAGPGRETQRAALPVQRTSNQLVATGSRW